MPSGKIIFSNTETDFGVPKKQGAVPAVRDRDLSRVCQEFGVEVKLR